MTTENGPGRHPPPETASRDEQRPSRDEQRPNGPTDPEAGEHAAAGERAPPPEHASATERPEADLLCLLSVPRALEERLIDWLLERGGATSFVSAPVDVHGVDPDALRGMEKVRGRQRRIQFQVPVQGARLDEFRTALNLEFADADVTWSIVPLTAFGAMR